METRSTTNDAAVNDFMSGLLAGKTAFVTGAAAGLGLALVEAFAAAGARGCVLDIADPAPLLPTGWIYRVGDVRDESSVAGALAAMKAALGRVDILVANAGIVPPWRDSEAIDFAEWDDIFAVNARGVAITIKQGVALMKETGGSIIVMASVSALAGYVRQATYVASKHAVLGVARATALDLGRFGIRVNALCPGPVLPPALLDRLRRRAEHGGPPAKEELRALAKTALGRIVTLKDVAGAALFLASGLSSGITGQTIVVDAGVLWRGVAWAERDGTPELVNRS
jgi:NAD(P)-dependent dehydrogenase (short-subunit alcohol dehydrogenase family)